MSSFPIVDLVIGMIFIFFLLSVINNSIIEIILTFLKVRAKVLETWLRTVFNESVTVTSTDGKSASVSLGEAIMNHLAVTALSGKGKSPSYIDARNFVAALLEKLTLNANADTQEAVPGSLDQVVQALKTTPLLSSELKRVFLAFAVQAKISYDATNNRSSSPYDLFRGKIEDWYNSSTDRLSGEVKRWSLVLTILISVMITLSLNVDSIAIARFLYSNSDVRDKIASNAYVSLTDTSAQNRAGAFMRANPNTNDSAVLANVASAITAKVMDARDANAMLQRAIPMGWDSEQLNEAIHNTNGILLQKIPGWLLTVFAICLGAPFWYDLLNRIANIRGTGPKPQVVTDLAASK